MPSTTSCEAEVGESRNDNNLQNNLRLKLAQLFLNIGVSSVATVMEGVCYDLATTATTAERRLNSAAVEL